MRHPYRRLMKALGKLGRALETANPDAQVLIANPRGGCGMKARTGWLLLAGWLAVPLLALIWGKLC